MNIDLEAFSSLRYIGVQTQHPPTNYNIIKNALRLEIENTTIRSPRQPDVIFKALDVSLFTINIFFLFVNSQQIPFLLIARTEPE